MEEKFDLQLLKLKIGEAVSCIHLLFYHVREGDKGRMIIWSVS